MLFEYYQTYAGVGWPLFLILALVTTLLVPGFYYHRVARQNQALLDLVQQSRAMRGALIEEVEARPPVLIKTQRRYDNVYVKELLSRIVKRFSEDELKNLAFSLDVDYENLGGDGKAGKALEFVKFIERQERIAALENEILKVRPNFFMSVEDAR